jgi:hypothetical protein
MLLMQSLPVVAAEMAHGFALIQHGHLAEQVGRLELVDRCPCNDDLCATFYTQPNGSWEGRDVERFVLEMPGLTCLYTVDGVVAWVELLRRPDVRDRLRVLFPQARKYAEPNAAADGGA